MTRWLHWPASAASAWSPSDLADLYAWYKSDAITGLTNNDPVSTWSDSSGNGYDVTASGADRPTYKTNTLNSMPVVEFTATHWLAASTAADWKFLHDATGSSVFLVLQYTRADRMAFMWTASFSSAEIGWTLCDDNLSGLRRAYQLIRGSGSWAVLNLGGNASIPLNTTFILGSVSDPGNATAASKSSIRVDGGSAITNNSQTGTLSTSNPSFPLTIGKAGSSSMDGLEGYIAEIVICNATLIDSDREKVEGYLAHKWGLTSSLPTGHPFKSSAP